MSPIDYEGRVFASTGAAESDGADGTVPAGHYHQHGDVVWAEISGGAVRRGALTGLCGPDGTLRFAYSQVLVDGTVVSGECVSHPELLPDGRVRLHERWRRHSPHSAQGTSVVEEL